MSIDRDDQNAREGSRPFQCQVCRATFETRHDPSLVYCPTCGSGDVRPQDGE